MEKIELSKVIHKELLMVGSKATTKAAIITELAKMLEEQNFSVQPNTLSPMFIYGKKKGKQALVKVWQSPMESQQQ